MGLPVASGGVVQTAEEAAALARSLGFPVAGKLASHEIIHKTEIGGVRLGLDGEPAVRRAFEDVRGRLESEGRIVNARIRVKLPPDRHPPDAASLKRHNGGSQS
jgi:acyl-CoA synthetase (NDP forming)